MQTTWLAWGACICQVRANCLIARVYQVANLEMMPSGSFVPRFSGTQ